MLDLSRLSPGHRKRSSPPSPQQDEEMEHSPQSKRSRKNWSFLQLIPICCHSGKMSYIFLPRLTPLKIWEKIDHKDLSCFLRAPQMMHKILLFKISTVSKASGVFFSTVAVRKEINASISKSALNLPNRDFGSSWDVYRERWLNGRKSARWVATWTLRRCTTGRFSTGRVTYKIEMDFTADFHPYSADSPGNFMEFSTEYSPVARKRRRSSSSSFHASRPPKRTLSRTPSSLAEAVATPRTWRRLSFLLVLLLLFLVFLLLSVATRDNSTIKHSLPYQQYLSIVDESKISPSYKSRLSNQEASEDVANTAEALNSLHVALELHRGGNLVKAKKVLSHALSLAPRDPRVLLHYGELMQEKNQLIEADHYYAR